MLQPLFLLLYAITAAAIIIGNTKAATKISIGVFGDAVGGVSPFCKIRKCAQKKEIEGCWLCEEIENCEKLDFLVPVHGDAHKKNLRNLKRKGKDAFVNGKRLWYNQTKP